MNNDENQKTEVTQSQPVTLKKADKKPMSKAALGGIIGGVTVAIIAIIVVLVMVLLPNDKKIISNGLKELKDTKSATLSASASSSSNVKLSKNPVLKVDLENETMSGEFEFEDSSLDTDKINAKIYSKGDDIYLSGESFAKAVNSGLSESMSSLDGDTDELVGNAKYDFEKGWIKMDNSSSSSLKGVKDYTASGSVSQLEKLFSRFDIDADDVEVISKETKGKETIFITKIDGDDAKVTIEDKKVTSIVRGEENDSDYVAVKDINKSEVAKVSDNDIYTQEKATEEVVNKFISNFTNYAVKNGLIKDSQKAEFEAALRGRYKDTLGSSLSI